MLERHLGMVKGAGQNPAAGSNKIAPVAQAEERLICNQQRGFSINPGCSNCGRADYG